MRQPAQPLCHRGNKFLPRGTIGCRRRNLAEAPHPHRYGDREGAARRWQIREWQLTQFLCYRGNNLPSRGQSATVDTIYHNAWVRTELCIFYAGTIVRNGDNLLAAMEMLGTIICYRAWELKSYLRVHRISRESVK